MKFIRGSRRKEKKKVCFSKYKIKDIDLSVNHFDIALGCACD